MGTYIHAWIGVVMYCVELGLNWEWIGFCILVVSGREVS